MLEMAVSYIEEATPFISKGFLSCVEPNKPLPHKAIYGFHWYDRLSLLPLMGYAVSEQHVLGTWASGEHKWAELELA